MEYIIGAIIGSVVTSFAIIALVFFDNRRRRHRIEDGELVSKCDGCPNNEIQIEAWYGQAEEDDGDAD